MCILRCVYDVRAFSYFCHAITRKEVAPIALKFCMNIFMFNTDELIRKVNPVNEKYIFMEK